MTLGFAAFKTVVIEQRSNEPEYVPRRTAHIVKIDRSLAAAHTVGKQVDETGY